MLWALLFILPSGTTSAAQPVPRPGETYEIVGRYEWSEVEGDQSSGSGSGSTGLIERVIAVREDGIELEYDLPANVPARERSLVWQYPARVVRSAEGRLQLLNQAELEARRDRWLERARLPREACGQWHFTWNAFQIQCDPEAILVTLEDLDEPASRLRAGAAFEDRWARRPEPLQARRGDANGTVLTVDFAIDPDAVHRDRAQADVISAGIIRQPLTPEAALRARAAQRVSGRVTIILETDGEGRLLRKTRSAEVETRTSSGEVSRETRTDTIERRRVSATQPGVARD